MFPVKTRNQTHYLPAFTNLSELHHHLHLPAPLDAYFTISEGDNELAELYQDSINSLEPAFYHLCFSLNRDYITLAAIKSNSRSPTPSILPSENEVLQTDLPDDCSKKYLLLVSDDLLPRKDHPDSLLYDWKATQKGNDNLPSPADQEMLCSIFRNMLVELRAGHPDRMQLLHFHMQILLLYLRRFYGSAAKTVSCTSGSLTAKFRQSVTRHMATIEISEEAKTVHFYARQLFVHPNHLTAVIKQHTGQSPINIIHQQVIDKAKSLLIQTRYSAKEIAYQLAFKSPAHFHAFFRKHTNQTPRTYRQSNPDAAQRLR